MTKDKYAPYNKKWYEKLPSEHFQTNLQQGNICSSISSWCEDLREILTHIDFDNAKGE